MGLTHRSLFGSTSSRRGDTQYETHHSTREGPRSSLFADSLLRVGQEPRQPWLSNAKPVSAWWGLRLTAPPQRTFPFRRLSPARTSRHPRRNREKRSIRFLFSPSTARLVSFQSKERSNHCRNSCEKKPSRMAATRLLSLLSVGLGELHAVSTVGS